MIILWVCKYMSEFILIKTSLTSGIYKFVFFSKFGMFSSIISPNAFLSMNSLSFPFGTTVRRITDFFLFPVFHKVTWHLIFSICKLWCQYYSAWKISNKVSQYFLVLSSMIFTHLSLSTSMVSVFSSKISVCFCFVFHSYKFWYF